MSKTSNSKLIPASSSSDYHTPVLLEECITGLNIKPGGTYVDCTFGGGGHSRSILQHLDEKSRLIVFDQDEAAEKNAPHDTDNLHTSELSSSPALAWRIHTRSRITAHPNFVIRNGSLNHKIKNSYYDEDATIRIS